jgi:hypothetical protein
MATKAEIKDAAREAVSDVVSEEITKARKMLTDGGDGTGTYKGEKRSQEYSRAHQQDERRNHRETVRKGPGD